MRINMQYRLNFLWRTRKYEFGEPETLQVKIWVWTKLFLDPIAGSDTLQKDGIQYNSRYHTAAVSLYNPPGAFFSYSIELRHFLINFSCVFFPRKPMDPSVRTASLWAPQWTTTLAIAPRPQHKTSTRFTVPIADGLLSPNSVMYLLLFSKLCCIVFS